MKVIAENTQTSNGVSANDSTQNSNSTQNSMRTAVKTGDGANVSGWVVLLAVSAAGTIFSLLFRRWIKK